MSPFLRRLDDQRGMTLVELVVTMAILVVASTIFLSVMASVQKAVGTETLRSDTNDQGRLALEELDREIRSGNLLYAPTNNGMDLTIYTQNNADIRTPGNQCVQWRIQNEQLQSRRWPSDWQSDPSGITDWRVVAESVENDVVNPKVAAFALADPTIARTIVVTLLVNSDPSKSANERVTASITGRDTEYGYPNSVCATPPP